MSDNGADVEMKEARDSRTAEQRDLDDGYNALIERIAGIDAVERPMKRTLDTHGQGTVLVATDPSDLGYHFTADAKPETLVMGKLAAIAVEFAFTADDE